MNSVRSMCGAIKSGRVNKLSKMSRCRKIAAFGGVALASLTALLSFGSSAFAGTVWQSSGATGNVVEASLPGQCYNTAYGYDVVAVGPSAYGFTGYGLTTETASWTARLYDATTNTYSAWSPFSQAYNVTASRGINFNSQRLVLPGIHGHVQYAQVIVEWKTTAGVLVGFKDYYVSTYGASSGGYTVSSCSA
jgi:hypothetical protein